VIATASKDSGSVADVIRVIAGLVILIGAGDLLVRGAVALSLRLGVPALIVSLTIVAIGTSVPELLISSQAVIEKVPGIAIGNVVGSNIANVLLVLGLPALFFGINTVGSHSRNSYYHMLAATALFVFIAQFAPLGRLQGLVLLAAFGLFLLVSVFSGLRQKQSGTRAAQAATIPRQPFALIGLFLGVGLIGLPLGAHFLVDGASSIARTYGVADAVIGLTLVALGTSLPELATTLSAAYRRNADIALGNVIGSNIANLLGIIGAAAQFGAIPISTDFLHFDIWVMVAAALVLGPFVVLRLNMTRAWGAILTVAYVLYTVLVLT